MKVIGVKQDKNFVSEIDRFLEDFDKKNPKKSESQLVTIEKHKKIHELRDKKTT